MGRIPESLCSDLQEEEQLRLLHEVHAPCYLLEENYHPQCSATLLGTTFCHIFNLPMESKGIQKIIWSEDETITWSAVGRDASVSRLHLCPPYLASDHTT